MFSSSLFSENFPASLVITHGTDWAGTTKLSMKETFGQVMRLKYWNLRMQNYMKKTHFEEINLAVVSEKDCLAN